MIPPPGPPSARHELTSIEAGAHGQLVHRWSVDNWTPFRRVMATRDGAQVFTPSVAGQRGRITSAAVAAGNHREWFLHGATDGWTDMEVEATLFAPSVWDTVGNNKPQQGLILRAQQVPDQPSLWRCFMVWLDSAFSTSGMLANTWLVDGTTLIQGSGQSPAFSLSLNACRRRSYVRWARRLDAFDADQYRVSPITPQADMWGMVNGDLITVAGMATASLNKTAVAAGNIGTNFFQLADATVGDVTDTEAGGTVDFDSILKGFWPRRIGVLLQGTDLWVKLWRPEEPAPDWSDTTRVAKVAMPTSPALPDGPGMAGVMFGHGHDSSYAEWGDLTFRRR